ncbi:unnamed protein product [Diplocarpon coronariae]|nr:hypothetical protein JHW43_004732 [Diplocarpon mali]
MSTSKAPLGRRVLGDLPTNASAATHRASSQHKSSISSAKPRILGEVLSPKSQEKVRMPDFDGAQAGLLGAKRKSHYHDNAREDGPMPRKRQARESGVWEPVGESIGARQLQIRDVPEVSLSPRATKSSIGPDDSLEVIASPMSSVSQNNVDLNDSQNTTITVPDDPPPMQASPLTREQLRQRASEIKLRLSLASYKVRTNQIDIPISRLEIRSSTTSSKNSSISRCTLNSSQTQRSRPSTASDNPNVSLQEPSAEKRRLQPVPINSSPPSYRSTQATRENLASPTKRNTDILGGVVTPLSPGQREGLLKPPILDNPGLGNDLTSSFVKGLTADGLLSLMQQQS